MLQESLLVARLLGAYELGLATVCIGVLLRPEPAVVRLGAWTLLAIHGGAAVAEIITLAGGIHPVVLANLLLRLALVALTLLLTRPWHPLPKP